jgi:hypothetical protein
VYLPFVEVHHLGSNPQLTDITSPFVSVVCGHDKMQDGYERLFLHAASTPGSFSKLHPRMHLMTGRGILSTLGGWGSRLLRGIFGSAGSLLGGLFGRKSSPNTPSYEDRGVQMGPSGGYGHKAFKGDGAYTGCGGSRATIAENLGYQGSGVASKRMRYH